MARHWLHDTVAFAIPCFPTRPELPFAEYLKPFYPQTGELAVVFRPSWGRSCFFGSMPSV